MPSPPGKNVEKTYSAVSGISGLQTYKDG